MYLKQIIEFLEAQPAEKVLPHGWGAAASYRGYYSDIAFVPASNVTIGSMLNHAKAAHGATFDGYKGGEYTMGDYTDCWIAHYGDASGDKVGRLLLQLLAAQP